MVHSAVTRGLCDSRSGPEQPALEVEAKIISWYRIMQPGFRRAAGKNLFYATV